MSEVGERIREIRERMGWSQRDLAKRANLSYSMISHIETGKREGTSDSIERIAAAFSISPGLLIDPLVDLDRLSRASQILHEIQYLDDDQLSVVEQMISALKSAR